MRARGPRLVGGGRGNVVLTRRQRSRDEAPGAARVGGRLAEQGGSVVNANGVIRLGRAGNRHDIPRADSFRGNHRRGRNRAIVRHARGGRGRARITRRIHRDGADRVSPPGAAVRDAPGLRPRSRRGALAPAGHLAGLDRKWNILEALRLKPERQVRAVIARTGRRQNIPQGEYALVFGCLTRSIERLNWRCRQDKFSLRKASMLCYTRTSYTHSTNLALTRTCYLLCTNKQFLNII